MSTYYMKGTLGPNQSTELFEMLVFPIHKLIDMDNYMEEELKKHIIEDEESEHSQYAVSIKELKNKQLKTLEYTSDLIKKFSQIPNNTSEFDFIDSYKNTVKTFHKHYSEFYSNIILIIEKENINDKEEVYFNNHYNKSNEIIDNSIDDFYKNTEKYAEKYDIDFN